MYDVIIIGAGVGGLSCAAKLAKHKKKILIIEKIPHIGGTSHIFKRKGYIFPMGPLSFSFPELVKKLLKDMDVKEKIEFERNHFQLISPAIDIIYSQQWNNFKEILKNRFKKDKKGIDLFFNELDIVGDAIKEVHEWHPDFLIGRKKIIATENVLKTHKSEFDIINIYNNIDSKDLLDNYIENESLKRLLGSQGTYTPIMNVVHLAFMWNVMSKEGIWFPSCGIHGINQLLYESAIIKNGGELKLNTPVKEILIKNNVAFGVKTSDDKIYESEWIVANADYKKVFLELINPNELTQNFLSDIRNTAYTGSELCVYLGIDPKNVDLSKMRTNHLFYRAKIDNSISKEVENFENKEIEICLWSNKSKNFAPENNKSLILRINMPYSHFLHWRLGEKRRKEGYLEYKRKLAFNLIETVENILPGLKSAIEVMEIATPLTYSDWGQRYMGSVAGWSRDIKKIRLNTKF
ncbi:MAG: phytoene desaturase family protein, partial [Candidatus Hermodarchaeota archaeon]